MLKEFIMGIFQGDLTISNMLKKSIADLRLNSWLLDHIFSNIRDQKEISNAKAFFLNNEFPIVHNMRKDSPPAMFISLSLGSSREDKSQAYLGDMSNEFVDYLPSEINKTIPYVVKPFNIISYDSATGIITMPENIQEFKYISAGMLSVDVNTGNAYKIIEVLSNSRYVVEIGAVITEKQAITPQYPIFRARMESATFLENYTIGIHTSGDVLNTIWLHSIVSYCLLRYRESLLEAEGFQISTISSSEFIKSEQYAQLGEDFFSRYITLEGQVQNFWIKTPQRFIESVDLHDSLNSIDPAGIKILSNKDKLPEVESQNDLWTSVKDPFWDE
jgi:hypothetical protein